MLGKIKVIRIEIIVTVVYFLFGIAWFLFVNKKSSPYQIISDILFVIASTGIFYFFLKKSSDISRKLIESEAEIRGIFNASFDMIVVVNKDRKIKEFNKKFQENYIQLFGKEPSLEGRYSHIYPVEEDRKLIESQIDRVLKGETFQFERVFNFQGDIRWYNIVYSPIFNSGNEVSSFVVSLTEITKFKNAELEILDSQAEIHAVFNYSTDALFISDENTYQIIDCNETALKLFELEDKSEILGKSGFSLNKFPISNDNIKNIGTSIAENKNIVIEFEYVTFKNNNFWGSFSAKRIQSGKGSFILIRITNISEKKLTEQKTYESEIRFRELANSSPVMLWVADSNGDITFYNSAWLNFTGRTLDQEIGNGWIDGVHKEDITTYVYDTYFDSFQKKKPYEIEFRLRRYDDEYRWIFESGIPKFNSQGDFEGFVGSAMDITDRKNAEIRLMHQEKFNSRISELSPDYIYIYDLEIKENIYSNRNFPELLGYRSDDYPVYNSWVFLKLIHPDDKERYTYSEEYFKKLKERGKCENELRMLGKNGEWVWVQTKETIFEADINGNPKQLLGNARDITSRKLAEEEILKANTELKLVNEEIDAFVYSASHDLRAPLASLLGLINIMKKEFSDENIHSYIGLMQKSIEKLMTVIQDLIDNSKNARIEINTELIDFNKLISDIIDDLKFHENAKNIHFDLEITGESKFYSDRLRIVMLFNNLISNAIKYHDMTKNNQYIRIRIQKTEDEAIIEVSDNGTGIDKKYHEKIFDMFYRVAKDKTGSGLGLYIVKGVLEKLKGEIKFESDIKVGTIFTVTIPNAPIKKQLT